MMETIFCLLGFSGDDPNFLHWSGWVRDNLRQKAPKIYLVGWLDLSVHRRRMLEERDVMPVDLAALPQGKAWPRDQRHRYATDWIHSRPRSRGDRITSRIGPRNLSKPRRHRASNLFGAYSSRSPQTCRKKRRCQPFLTLPAKGRDRIEGLRKAIAVDGGITGLLYPGWLIAPEHVRQQLWNTTGAWIRELLALLDDLNPFGRLQAIAQNLAWRLNKCTVSVIFGIQRRRCFFCARYCRPRRCHCWGRCRTGGCRLARFLIWL